MLAEGIETERHLRTALALGATLGQGWLFGRPQALSSSTVSSRDSVCRTCAPHKAPSPGHRSFLQTPSRNVVVQSKLITAVLVAGLAWLVSTVLAVVAGALFLHSQSYSTAWIVGRWTARSCSMERRTCCGRSSASASERIRNQLVATVSATLLYLVGATAAGTVFDLLNTYVLDQNWVLAAQVVVPPVASNVMVSATASFDQSPAAWVGAVVLLAWSVAAGLVGVRALQRRDIS